MNAAKRARFLLDLAEELTWLKEHARGDGAECWYESLPATIQFIRNRQSQFLNRKVMHPFGVEPKTF